MDPSRRRILKLIAAAPLVLIYGSAANAVMRFAKPTMKPYGFFDRSDQPTSALDLVFTLDDFPEPWTCLPFTFHQKYTEFNPEQAVIRKVPGFIIRLPDNKFVAYSRICPYRGCGYLNFVPEPSKLNCGCGTSVTPCCCFANVPNPVLMCPCDLSTFDLANDARVVQGPAPRPARTFDLAKQGDKIAVISLEAGGVA